jgi:hypothetical protein
MRGVRVTRRGWLAIFIALLGLLGGLLAPRAEAAPSRWDSAKLDVTGWPVLAAPLALPTPNAGDGIGPGSYLLIDQADGTFICTANFVWNGPGGERYLGAAGHCFLPPDVDAAPANDPDRYVSRVQVCVADCLFGGQLGAVIQGTFVDLGPVAYARQSRGDIDVGNDFGLVTIPAGTPGVRTTVPVWGGPTGSASIGVLSPVCIYGNAMGLGEVFATKARAGLGSSTHDGAWFANIPAFQGDSGSAMVNCPGLTGTTAVGILTHLATDGTGIVAGTTVAQARAMVAAETGMTITLATA